MAQRSGGKILFTSKSTISDQLHPTIGRIRGRTRIRDIEANRRWSDKRLLRICDWEKISHIPTESAVLRAFAEHLETQLQAIVHAVLMYRTLCNGPAGHMPPKSIEIEGHGTLKKGRNLNERQQ